MNLREQFAEALEWVRHGLDLNSDRYNNLFEITIRILGGLLSAFHLSAENVFLEKAYDLCNRTLVAFDTKSYIPLSDVNLGITKKLEKLIQLKLLEKLKKNLINLIN